MKTDRFERGSYMVFDTATWDCMRKVPALTVLLPSSMRAPHVDTIAFVHHNRAILRTHQRRNCVLYADCR